MRALARLQILLALLSLISICLILASAASASVDYEYPLSGPTTVTWAPQTPTTVTASSTDSGGSAAAICNNAGMTGSWYPQDLHDANYTDMWMSSISDPDPWVQIDLGGVYPVGKILVWNYNEYTSGVSCSGRGIQYCYISYSVDGANWTMLPGPHSVGIYSGLFQLAEAPTTGAYTPATNQTDGPNAPIDFQGLPARYIMFTPLPGQGLGNWGGAPGDGSNVFYGLSQVRVYRYASNVRGAGNFIAARTLQYSSATDGWVAENTVNNWDMSDAGGGNYTASATVGTTNAWLSAANDPTPYIIYDLGGAYTLGSMSVWNYNSGAALVGRGLRNVSIYYSITNAGYDPDSIWGPFAFWTKLTGPNYDGTWTFNQASGSPWQTATNNISFGDVYARYVMVVPNVGSGNGNWGGAPGDGGNVYYGLSQVRFFVGPGIVAEPAPYWTGLMGQRSLSGTTAVWSGADCGYSIPYVGPAGDIRSLLAFGDTFKECWTPTTYRRCDPVVFLRQSWATCGAGVTLTPSLSDIAFDTSHRINATEGGLLWPNNGLFIATSSSNTGNIYVLAGRFNTSVVKQGVKLIVIPVSNGALQMDSTSQYDTGFYSSSGGVSYSFDACMYNNAASDGYVYIYGYKQIPDPFFGSVLAAIVARVTPANLTTFSSWRFWDGASWVTGFTNATPISSFDVAFLFNITPAFDSAHAGQYMMTTMQYDIGAVEVGYSSSLTGPFSSFTRLYIPPESDPDWYGSPKHVWFYSPCYHPQWSRPGEALISYSENAYPGNNTYLMDSEVYSPRFIRVRSIPEPPVAAFSYTPSSPTPLDPVHFTDGSSDLDGIIVSRAWSFGDGATSSELNPSHQYGAIGSYTVTLTVTDDKGAVGTIAQEIAVHGNTLVGTGVSVSFDDTALTFDLVTAEGLTTGTFSSTPPALLPAGLLPVGQYRTISTTAGYDGNIAVVISYQEGVVPAEEETNLKLLQYDETSGTWVDITSSVDTVNDAVTGHTTRLGVFALAIPGVTAPQIERYSICQFSLDEPGGQRWFRAINVRIRDPNGPANIVDYSIETPAGIVISAAELSRFDLPDGSVTITRCEYLNQIRSALGSYAFRVRNSQGEETVFHTSPITHFPSPLPQITSPVHGSVVSDPMPPLFTWEPYPGFARDPGPKPADGQSLSVRDLAGGPGWWISLPVAATSARYGTGGSPQPAPPLQPGHTYRVSLSESLNPELLADNIGYYSETTCHAVDFRMYASPNPVIQEMNVDRGRDISVEGTVTYHEQVAATITDDDGLADIASITVIDSEGHPHTPGRVEEQPASVKVEWSKSGLTQAPKPGLYKVQVVDKEGHSQLLSGTAAVVSELSPLLTMPAPDDALLPEADTRPIFCWCNGILGTDTITVWDEATGEQLWQVLPAARPALYNYDGSATQPQLSPGYTYGWMVSTSSCDDCGVSNPRVNIRTTQHSYGRFAISSENPAIQNVEISRRHSINAASQESFAEWCSISVSDTHGWDDLVSVTTVDPAGQTRPAPVDVVSSRNIGRFLLDTVWGNWSEPTPPVRGSYTVTAWDAGSHVSAPVVATATRDVPEVHNISFPVNGSVITQTVPTFTWEAVPGVSHWCLCLMEVEAGGDRWMWNKVGIPGHVTSVASNDNGLASKPELVPGSFYRLYVTGQFRDDDRVTDARVSVSSYAQRIIKFRVANTVSGSNVTVTVGDPASPAIVAFQTVVEGGDTSAEAASELPSGDPSGYPIAGYGWNIATTAVVAGKITVTVHYDDACIPAGQEGSLLLVRWDGSHWVDITVARDPVNNTLTGECTSLGRFAIYLPYPTLPELPGKLAYGACPWQGGWAVMRYSSDPTARLPLLQGTQFFETQFFDWSPDGATMLYTGPEPWPNTSLWRSQLDGSPPQQIPSVTGTGPRWSPDGGRVVYVHRMPEGTYQVRTARTDGTGEQTVAASPTWSGVSDWSPDGAWIAYGLRPDTQGQGLWRVRYDGTDPTPILATGVAGHSDWQVVRMMNGAWSPDGSGLVVWFEAKKQDGSWAQALGVIPAGGGLLTPAFILPVPLCCGSPWYPRWSPDGTQIVLASSFHLAAQAPEGEPAPGAEVWLVNADGSGQPTRLTYNDAYESWVSWSAPNTQPTGPGGSSTVTKGDTTITFENVATPGVTTATVSEIPPGPEPQGFQFLGEYYDIHTSAQISGTITIQIHYEDSELPGGQEQWLSLLHWENDHWVDITVRPIDTVNNFITGECTSLSQFAVAVVTGRFGGVLHGSRATANPPVLSLDGVAPVSATAKYKDSPSIAFRGGNPWKEVGTWTAAPDSSLGELASLGDLHVWLGLENSDDQGTCFDVRADIYRNGVLVVTGLTRAITGVTRNPDLAKQVSIPFGAFTPVELNGTSDVLSLKIWTRIGTNLDDTKYPGHSSAVGLRLYFDAVNRASAFSAGSG